MRKLNLVMIIVWSLVALLIVVALVGGIAYRNIGSIGIIGGADGPTAIFTTSGNRELLLNETYSLDGVEGIDVDLMSEAIDIFPAADNQLRVVQYGLNLQAHQHIVVVESGNTIAIRRVGNGSGLQGFSLFNFNFISDSWVEIYLPADYQKDLNLDLTSGTVKVDTDLKLRDLAIDISSGTLKSEYNISAADAGIEITSGTMKLERLDTTRFDIKMSSGSVRINNLSGSGDVDITSGNLKLYNVAIGNSLNVGASSGTIDMSLTGNPSLEFKGQVSSGDIRTYFDKYSKDDHNRNYIATVGDGPYKQLSVDVTSGTVQITNADS